MSGATQPAGTANAPGASDDATLDERDTLYLRRAIAFSALAAQRGSRPFGAVVVGAGGEVLAEAWNDTARGDCTATPRSRRCAARAPRTRAKRSPRRPSTPRANRA